MTGILHTEITKDTKTDLVGGLRSLVIPFLCDLCVDRLSGSESYTPRSQGHKDGGPSISNIRIRDVGIPIAALQVDHNVALRLGATD